MPEKNLESFYVNLNGPEKRLPRIIHGRHEAMELMRKHVETTRGHAFHEFDKNVARAFLEGKHDEAHFTIAIRREDVDGLWFSTYFCEIRKVEMP